MKVNTSAYFVILILFLALPLSACGRKAPLRPPEGQADRFTYPNFYPNPEETMGTTVQIEPAPVTIEEEPLPDEIPGENGNIHKAID